MNFFCTKKDYDAWTAQMEINEDDVFCLEAKEALVVAKMLFGLSEK